VAIIVGPGRFKGRRCDSEARSCPMVLLTCDMDQPKETPTLPPRFYRRKAAESRRSAEAVTTRAVKERLHNLARDFDRLADTADRAEQTSDPVRPNNKGIVDHQRDRASPRSGERRSRIRPPRLARRPRPLRRRRFAGFGPAGTARQLQVSACRDSWPQSRHC
jgi:hypothetical protein